MATEYHYWSGKTKWAKVYRLDTYGNYSMDFYPDNPKDIPDAGLKLEPKEDADGVYYRLRREPQKVIKGEPVLFGQPKVVVPTGETTAEGIPVVEPFTKLIGNGSRVTVKVAVFPAGKFRGHRLESVRVDEHVPYEPNSDAQKPQTPDFPF